jgi:hypothetical protein
MFVESKRWVHENKAGGIMSLHVGNETPNIISVNVTLKNNRGNQLSWSTL